MYEVKSKVDFTAYIYEHAINIALLAEPTKQRFLNFSPRVYSALKACEEGVTESLTGLIHVFKFFHVFPHLVTNGQLPSTTP